MRRLLFWLAEIKFPLFVVLLLLPVSASGAGGIRERSFPIGPTGSGSSGPDIGNYLLAFIGIIIALGIILSLAVGIANVAHKWRISRDARALPTLQFKAENRDVGAQYKLGWMYEHGEGVKENSVEARKWYQKAKDQGHPNAAFRIAEMNAATSAFIAKETTRIMAAGRNR
jgi:TPR repeat protein